MNYRSLFFALASMIGAAACSAQVGPDNQGEPLVVFRGQVVANNREPAAAPATAALLWLAGNASIKQGGAFSFVGVSVPVAGEFPVGFEMQVYSPPPDAVLGGLPIGFAYVVALAPNADPAALLPADVLGMSLDTIVVYLAKPVPPDSPAAPFVASMLGPDPAPGYHLVNTSIPTSEQANGYVQCTSGGVCPRLHLDSSIPAKFAAYFDQIGALAYASCVEATPKATTCELWPAEHPTAAQKGETEACISLRDARKSTDCTNPIVNTPAEPSKLVTVTMGKNPWQWQERWR